MTHLWGIFTAIGIVLAATPGALAQDQAPSVLDRIFGARTAPEPVQQTAQQADAAELIVRIDRLEAQIRQLTGTVEQLQHRNQQLEAQIKSMESPAAPKPPQGPAAARPQPVPPAPTVAAPVPPAPPLPAPPPGRRSDVFDPNQQPNAPGAPRPLGTLPSGPAPGPQVELPRDDTAPIGVPDGRAAGAPLDLSTLATGIPRQPPSPDAVPPTGTALPAPPPRTLSSTGTAVAPPSETSQGYYDLAYGYVLRKDYAFAEEAFKTFLSKYPNDTLVPDAQFWLGESLFQRQRYDSAAEQFLAAATKHPGYAKAPDALLRLAQSLAAINQKEMACATLAEVGRKYPRASNTVKQGVEREQKRVRC
jgi:tol-pal system protein YbgF